MGRNKKEVVTNTNQELLEDSAVDLAVEPTSMDVTAVNPVAPNKNNTLKYTGAVSIKVERGNRVIFSNRSHNEGGLNLFKFLATCIAGDYAVADGLIPCKIMTFYSGASTPAEWAPNQENTKRSNFKFKEGHVEIVNTTDNSGAIPSYSATIHFRLPFSWINGDEINVIGLYAKNAVLPGDGVVGDFAAIYKVVREDESGDESWDPISTTDQDANLIIDWTLSILNK